MTSRAAAKVRMSGSRSCPKGPSAWCRRRVPSRASLGTSHARLRPVRRFLDRPRPSIRRSRVKTAVHHVARTIDQLPRGCSGASGAEGEPFWPRGRSSRRARRVRGARSGSIRGSMVPRVPSGVCPVCGSSQLDTRYGPSHFLECPTCGLARVVGYDGSPDYWETKETGDPYWTAAKRRYFLSALSLLPRARLLDLGGGVGEFVGVAVGAGWDTFF